MPKISVIVPFYNLSQYVKETLDSLVNQTFTDFECLIVDDGSRHEEAENLSNIVSSLNDSRFTICTKENGGIARALNYGFEKSCGDYIVVLSSDDCMDPEYLRNTKVYLEAMKVDIVGVDTLAFGDASYVYTTGNSLDLATLLVRNPLHYCCLMKRNVWETVGGFTPDIPYEDWDFWISAAERNFNYAKLPQPLFLYRERQGSRDKEALINHNECVRIVLGRHQQIENSTSST